jgi:deoxycytidylate deaminase
MKTYEEWLVEAYKVATSSPDPSTQNGAIVLDKDYNILGKGCNTFTKGVELSPEKLEKPLKYSYVEHAERNAVFNCLDTIRTNSAGEWIGKGKPDTMVVPWAACVDCARSIIQSGIHTLVRHRDATDRSPDHWIESITLADELLREGSVEVINVKGFLGAPEILHNGVLVAS